MNDDFENGAQRSRGRVNGRCECLRSMPQRRSPLARTSAVLTMMTTTTFAIALAFVGTVAAAPFTIPVGDLTLEFDPGPDYCMLDEAAHEADRLAINQQRQANRNRNEVLAMFAPCTQLVAFREGVSMTRFGILLTTYLKGRIQPIPGMERSRFLKIMNEQWQQAPRLDIREANKRIKEADDAIGTVHPDGGAVKMLSEPRQLGVLHKDEAALYIGMVLSVAGADTTYTVASVMAPTLVRGHHVQYTLYENGDEATAHALLRSLQQVMRALVARNDPNDTPVGGARTLMDRVENVAEDSISAGVVGFASAILLLVPVAIVAWIRRTYRRRRARAEADPDPSA